MGWSMDKKYNVMGTALKTNSEYLMIFDLKSAKALYNLIEQGKAKCTVKGFCFPKEWEDSFGLTVKEHEASMMINLFDDYMVFRLNG